MKTSRLSFRILAALVLSTVVAGTSGCLVVAAGAASAGTVAYIRGELNATLGNNEDSVARATSQAIEQLQFAKISEQKDALSAKFIVRTARDKKIEIQLSKLGDNLTKVQIRVGVFGDEPLSIAILDKIKANL